MDMQAQDKAIRKAITERMTGRLVSAACALTVALSAALLPSVAEARECVLPVTQRYTTNASGSPDTVMYELVADDPSSPMPDGASDGTYLFYVSGSVTEEVPIELDGAYDGQPWYTLRQASQDFPDGLTLDDASYRIQVSHDGDGGLVAIAYDADGEKATDVVFDVSYEKPAKPYDPATDPTGGQSSPDTGLPPLIQQILGALPQLGDSWPYVAVGAVAVGGVILVVLGLRKGRRDG